MAMAAMRPERVWTWGIAALQEDNKGRRVRERGFRKRQLVKNHSPNYESQSPVGGWHDSPNDTTLSGKKRRSFEPIFNNVDVGYLDSDTKRVKRGEKQWLEREKRGERKKKEVRNAREISLRSLTWSVPLFMTHFPYNPAAATPVKIPNTLQVDWRASKGEE